MAIIRLIQKLCSKSWKKSPNRLDFANTLNGAKEGGFRPVFSKD